MEHILVVVDMQNDFIDGALGTKEAREIVEAVAEKIREFKGSIYGTLDTHSKDYLSTQEGKNLPVPHCILGEEGWALHPDIMDAISETEAEVMDFCRKDTFGSIELCELLKQRYEGKDAEIQFIGLCTDICVISNALMVKAALPEAKLIVHADLCAGVTKESHDNALNAMKMCQVDIQTQKEDRKSVV